MSEAVMVQDSSGSIFSKAFWKGAGERAVKTFAQAFVAVFGVGTATEVSGAYLSTETWVLALVSGLAAAVLSVVFSVANPGFVAGAPTSQAPAGDSPEAVAPPAQEWAAGEPRPLVIEVE